MKIKKVRTICLCFILAAMVSGCSVKSEVRKKPASAGEEGKEDISVSDINADLSDEYAMFHMSCIDLDDIKLMSRILGEDIQKDKVTEELSEDGADGHYTYSHNGSEYTWACELKDGHKTGFSFFYREGEENKEVKLEDADGYIREILKEIGCEYDISEPKMQVLEAEEGDEKTYVNLEYNFLYNGAEIAGNRGIEVGEDSTFKTARASYVNMEFQDGLLYSLNLVSVPDKIEETKVCKKDEFISLEELANIVDKSSAYPSSQNIYKVDIIYASLPLYGDYMYSPLYEVLFEEPARDKNYNSKDIMLVEAFTGRVYR